MFWRKREDHFFYAPKERQIYQYWDGQKTVLVDPMALVRKMADVGPELKIDLEVADSLSKDANKAGRAALEKVQKIFNLKSYTEGGLTEDETFDLFGKFLAYREAVKKNSKSTATSQPVMSPITAPSSSAVPPTANGSDSGSTGKEPLPEPPLQSKWGYESHSDSATPACPTGER